MLVAVVVAAVILVVVVVVVRVIVAPEGQLRIRLLAVERDCDGSTHAARRGAPSPFSGAAMTLVIENS